MSQNPKKTHVVLRYPPYEPSTFDPSVLGISEDELAAMSEEEQEEFAHDACNRAANLLQNVVAALGAHFRPTERQALMVAANGVIHVTRGAYRRVP